MKNKLRLYAWLFGLGILPLLAQAAIYNTGGIPTKDTGSNNRVFVSEFNTMVKVLENLYYNDGSKRIGIGTSSPATSLSIVAPRPILSLGTNDGSNKGIRFEYNEAAQELRIQAGTADGAFDGANLMVIERDTFKVGIGDADPDGDLRLDVEGKIGATEYCDQDGNNCVPAADLNTTVNSGVVVEDLIKPNYISGYTTYNGPKNLANYHVLEFGGFDSFHYDWNNDAAGTASTMMLILPYSRGAVNLGSNGQDAQITAEFDKNKRLSIKIQGGYKGRPRLAFARAIRFEGGMTADPTSAPQITASFISQYAALMNDPNFRSYVNNDPDLPVFKYRDDHGWYIRSLTNAHYQRTTDRLCQYFMEEGKYAGKFWGTDYGSDNNNHAKFWNGSEWSSLGHGDNGAIDITRLNCQGKSILPRGQFWLESNRKEKCWGSAAPWQGGRCNPYPKPPKR